MERIVTIEDAQRIFGKNFIGVADLQSISCTIDLQIPFIVPSIPYSREDLERSKDEYVLILGVNLFKDNSQVNIRNLKLRFGIDPFLNEPCFYNQDWYNNETFVDRCLDEGWFLIRKEVFNSTRATSPDLLSDKFNFPSAIQCAYLFFVMWLLRNEIIWEYDFIWCSDHDHNGDRIYVGKYKDIDGVNKNGFSIHRHLSLRTCYAVVDCI